MLFDPTHFDVQSHKHPAVFLFLCSNIRNSESSKQKMNNSKKNWGSDLILKVYEFFNIYQMQCNKYGNKMRDVEVHDCRLKEKNSVAYYWTRTCVYPRRNSPHLKWIYGFWLISVFNFNLKEPKGVILSDSTYEREVNQLLTLFKLMQLCQFKNSLIQKIRR